MPDPNTTTDTTSNLPAVSANDSTPTDHQSRNGRRNSPKNRGSKNDTRRRQNKKETLNSEDPNRKEKEPQPEGSGQKKSTNQRRKKNQNQNQNLDNDKQPQNKNSDNNKNESKRRPITKKKNKDFKKEDKDFKISVDKSKREFSIRRDNEIAQCVHLLSNRNFRIFKRGQYVTSYGFTRNQKLLGIPNCKFIVNIPLDYPKSPIKLQYGKSNLYQQQQQQQQSSDLEEKLDRLTKNFNSKSNQLLSKGEPIISQLNYFVENAECLSQPNYKSVDKRAKAFLNKFV